MILKSFKESAYKIVPFETVSEWKGIKDYTVHHFFCEFDIFHLSLLKYTWLKVVKKLAK